MSLKALSSLTGLIEALQSVSGALKVTLAGQLPSSLGQKAASASLSVTYSAVTPIGSSALEKSHVVSDSACTIRWAKALNNSGVDLWLFVLNAASYAGDGGTPATGTIPIPVPAGSVNGDAWPDGGLSLSAGCVLALSTTLATCTRITSNDAWFAAGVQ